jgi:hypothetical protein
MTRFLTCVTTLAFVVAPITYAAAQADAASGQQAKYADQALKSCNYDLDHDRFGNYASIDECVADRAQKLARDDQRKAAALAPKPN